MHPKSNLVKRILYFHKLLYIETKMIKAKYISKFELSKFELSNDVSKFSIYLVPLALLIWNNEYFSVSLSFDISQCNIKR